MIHCWLVLGWCPLTRLVTDLQSVWLTGMASHPPIPIMDLADHLERLKANDNLKFSQEYEVSVYKCWSSNWDECCRVLSHTDYNVRSCLITEHASRSQTDFKSLSLFSVVASNARAFSDIFQEALILSYPCQPHSSSSMSTMCQLALVDGGQMRAEVSNGFLSDKHRDLNSVGVPFHGMHFDMA